jgi:hypothetical protein
MSIDVHKWARWCISIVLAFGAAVAAHAQAGNVATILRGQLTTGKAATPVVNAMVQWSMVGAGPGVSTVTMTDSNGDFGFEIPIAASTEGQLSTIANLYLPTQTNVQLQPGITSQVNIKLVRKPSGQYGTVSGVVRSTTTRLGVPNATVSILNAGDLLTTTTDASGKFQLKQVGFNSNLTLQAATASPPCIAPAQAPLSVNSAHISANLLTTTVLAINFFCPPPLLNPGSTTQVTIDRTVQWQQADGSSIISNGAPNAYNAGRVNDILRLPPGQGLLVASDEGGVWTIAEDATKTATPLSNLWPAVSMSALAFGVNGAQDFYAGTFPYGDSPGGFLWETDTSQTSPLSNWAPVNGAPPCGSIYKILTIADAGKIVLACDTGLYWSEIPSAPSVKGTYNWVQAQPVAVGSKPFSGLAQGPGWSVTGAMGTIVATRFGGSSPNQLIYTGKWSGSKLVLTASSVKPASSFDRTSVAACASNMQIMYAIAAEGTYGETLTGVFQSSDGGFDWGPVTLPPNPGLQGDSNQAIAISPDCSAVALGWQTGTFVSFTAGSSWNLLTETGEYNDLHLDITALTFDPALPGTLFIGSGGGVASAMGVTNGSTPTFESDWNRNLFNLEFFDGGGSSSFHGLVAAAAQDNGVLYAALPGAWQHVIDCGGIGECWGESALFVTPASIGSGNDVLVDQNLLGPDAAQAGAIESVGGVIPFNGQMAIPLTSNETYNVTVAAPVRYPGGVVNASGQAMIAVAELYAYNSGDGIYGLFSNNDGSDPNWELLNSGPGLWNGVTAIAPTYDGSSIFVGNSIGWISRLDAPTPGAPPAGPANALPIFVPSGCAPCPVTGLYAFNPYVAFATYGDTFLLWNGTLIGWGPWVATDQGTLPHDREFLSVVATDPNRVYIASSSGVFDATDGGFTWFSASTGLPALIPGERGNGFEPPAWLGSHDYLGFITEPSGDTRLYLASYGRSLWRTNMPLPPTSPYIVFTSVQIQITTGNDDAQANSEIQATISNPVTLGTQSICLKPSTSTEPSPGGVCTNGPGAVDQEGNQSWANWQTVLQTFPLSLALDGAAMTIQLYQHNGGSDSWDLEILDVTGFYTDGSLLLSGFGAAPMMGNNCIARLRPAPDVGSVTYVLSVNDPEQYNYVHPVANFGPTPPGSCPQ